MKNAQAESQTEPKSTSFRKRVSPTTTSLIPQREPKNNSQSQVFDPFIVCSSSSSVGMALTGHFRPVF
jgi:hypothetical protein